MVTGNFNGMIVVIMKVDGSAMNIVEREPFVGLMEECIKASGKIV